MRVSQRTHVTTFQETTANSKDASTSTSALDLRHGLLLDSPQAVESVWLLSSVQEVRNEWQSKLTDAVNIDPERTDTFCKICVERNGRLGEFGAERERE